MANEIKIEIKADGSQAEKVVQSLRGKVDGLASGMKSAGKKMSMGITAPIVGMGIGIIKSGADFQKAMNRVRVVSGATGSDLESLTELAKELGSTTQFSASEAAEGMNFLAMAGFEANDIMTALPATLSLAAAGQMELADAADIASNILTGYNMETKELGHATDVLTKTFTSTNTDLVQLGEAFKFVGPVAASAGFEFEEMAAATGMLGNAGIQAGMAGTSLRGAITRLLTPSTEAQTAIDQLGLSLFDNQGNLISFSDIIGQLEEAGASTADMMTIFGQRAGPAMSALVTQGADAMKNLTQELKDSAGTTDEVAAVSMEGFAGVMKEVKSAIEGFAIALADSGILEFMEGLAKKLAVAVRWLSDTPAPVKTVVVIIAALAAAIGPLLIVLGMMLPAITAITAAAPLMGAAITIATGPIGAIVLAIAAAIAIGVLIVKNWEKIRDAAKMIFEKIFSLYESNWGWLLPSGPLIKGVIFMVRFIRDNFDTIKSVIVSAFGFIAQGADALIGAFNMIMRVVTTVFGGGLNIIINFVNTVIDALNKLPSISIKGVGKLGFNLDRLENVDLTAPQLNFSATDLFKDLTMKPAAIGASQTMMGGFYGRGPDRAADPGASQTMMGGFYGTGATAVAIPSANQSMMGGFGMAGGGGGGAGGMSAQQQIAINISAETIIGSEDVDELVTGALDRAQRRGALGMGFDNL